MRAVRVVLLLRLKARQRLLDEHLELPLPLLLLLPKLLGREPLLFEHRLERSLHRPKRRARVLRVDCLQQRGLRIACLLSKPVDERGLIVRIDGLERFASAVPPGSAARP